MRTLPFRATLVGALSILAAGAAAQVPASPVLNSVQVRTLIARAEPGDHARLAAHFGALADQYLADATQDTARSRVFMGNPNRRTIGRVGRYARLASEATESVTTLQQLAAHHARLAEGTASVAPEGSARFEEGRGARVPTDEEILDLAASARTPSDHQALAKYYLTLASDHTATAEKHAGMSRASSLNTNRRGGHVASHCDRLVRESREAANKANMAAATHEQLARISG